MSNSHIHEFALDYCFSNTPPRYALLLTGAWGSGKTWFIEKLINELNNKETKELYISLYGLSSFSAIEYEFYRKLHPVLSKKGMELAGKVLKGALKATIKLDLDMDGKDDASATASIPSVNLPEYLTNTSGFTLIFDDIERCSINLPDLLGYINHFVEHQNYKAILIANEEELDKNDKYKLIKEKLVGRTFEITPQIDEALDKFIEDSGLEKFFEPHRELIKEIHHQSGYKNLRHLRQAILEFSRLEQRLPDDITQSSELMAHFLRLFLVFTFEIRHGKMAPNDILNLKDQWINYSISKSRDNKTTAQEKPLAVILSEKYADFESHDLLLEINTWIDILWKGIIDASTITDHLKNSRYLVSKTSPNWVRLWNFRSHSDTDFTTLASEVWQQFKTTKFTAHHEIKHIVGMMIFFSEHGLFEESIESITETAVTCIDAIREQGHFSARRTAEFREDESALGMCYFSREHEKFRDICEHLRKQERESYLETLPSLGERLLSKLEATPSAFSQSLYTSSYGCGEYYDTPILRSILPEAFTSTLFKLKSEDLYDACKFFKERYRASGLLEIHTELQWITAVKYIIDKEAAARPKSLFGHCLKEVSAQLINKALEDLKSCNQRLTPPEASDFPASL